jgi:ankyrin repeat protein
MNPFGVFRFGAILALLAILGAAPVAARADALEDYFHSVVMDDADAVKRHLAQGMNPNAKQRQGGHPGLVIALLEGSMRVFDVLVNTPGIDLDAAANNGNNALMIAAFKGNRLAFDVLLQKGAAIDRPRGNWTPLHYAAAGGHNRLVEVLLDRGADINARSPNQTTPLMIAAHEGFDLTVRYLIERGADVLLVNQTGLNAADYAKHLDRQDIIDLVNQHIQVAEQRRAATPCGNARPSEARACAQMQLLMATSSAQ